MSTPTSQSSLIEDEQSDAAQPKKRSTLEKLRENLVATTADILGIGTVVVFVSLFLSDRIGLPSLVLALTAVILFLFFFTKMWFARKLVKALDAADATNKVFSFQMKTTLTKVLEIHNTFTNSGTVQVATVLSEHNSAIESKLGEIAKQIETLKKSGQEDKFEKMKQKYKYVPFKDKQATNEFTPAEANVVKIGLIKGVKNSVYAIHRIETYLPFPMDKPDDRKYFEDNKKALERIENEPRQEGKREENNIHRIFVISKEVLEDPALVDKMKARIQEHCDAKFDVKMVPREELVETPDYEFAIYDKEISLRLSINEKDKCYGLGVVYFDDAVWRDIYMHRYWEIATQSYRPDEFWERLPQYLKN